MSRAKPPGPTRTAATRPAATAPAAGEYTAEVLADLERMVREGLAAWDLPATTRVELLNVSENATYALSDESAGRQLVLRLHRVAYSSIDEIDSELAWIAALRATQVIATAAPQVGADGKFVQTLRSPSRRPARHAVVFERLPGREPETGGDANPWFERLGFLTARLHAHARAWILPQGFCRKCWDLDAMIGPYAYWGDWRAGLGLDAQGATVIELALAEIRARLQRYGRGPARFGLIHADLRLANLLADGDDLRIIDFDDCGFSWFLYDFATAVSFIEHEAHVPDLLAAWLRGYRQVGPLAAEDLDEIPGLLVLRRVLLTAWLASHAEVPFARRFGAQYTEGTVLLARQLLAGCLYDGRLAAVLSPA
jgi:Ser/Thr protein kinase RdoA (MazF antagonist)